MEGPDTFTPLPLSLDPATKAVTSPSSTLAPELENLNTLHRMILALETPNNAIPPPAPVNPKRSVQITKLRESANANFKKAAYPEAIGLYDLAVKMASDRPPWEASGLVREELSALYGNRAQAQMGRQSWAEGAVDAEVSVEMKRVGNVKGWWRRGICLREMGRLGEAREWCKQGLDFERAGPDKQNIGELETLVRELEKALEKS